MAKRGPKGPHAGQFQKGVSGNPGGRHKDVAEVKELARVHTPAAIETLAEIMMDKEAQKTARVAAANALLDRAYGRPETSVQHSGTIGGGLGALLDAAFNRREQADAEPVEPDPNTQH
jgi:hypothetical protein